QFWQDADVILGIGIKLTNLENYGEPPTWPKGAKRIIIHESQTDAWAPVPSVLEIIGSPKLVLRQMIECARSLMGQRPERKDWLDKLAAVRKRYDASIEEMLAEVRERKPIHGFLLAKEIVDFLDPTATIIYDSYGGSAQLTDKITAKFAGQILDAGEHAGVGHGIGMGIGAQLARPGKQVMVMIGDGGLGIGGMDIETALRYHLPVVYVVYNNSAWMGGMENLYFRGQIDSWDMLPNLRYDRMFKTIGCHGEYVTKPQDIRPALERAFNSGKTAVVNVIVDSRVPNPSSLNAGRLAMATTDPSKWSELTRELIMNGYTPEVEEKFRKAGWPPMRLKAKIPRAEGARLWKG
ncbi:MAG: thiamine pyrophosphate-dependent enzyme, partial [Chloroflexota bacterium]|nr:thiamine pyrophosphate-dependent enzyme [Chloroflexota bacterium]